MISFLSLPVTFSLPAIRVQAHSLEQGSSIEELIARVRATANAFRQYLELSKKPKVQILARLVAAGYAPDKADAEPPEVQKATERFHASGAAVRRDNHEHPGPDPGRAP
jgi:hypothetical protein